MSSNTAPCWSGEVLHVQKRKLHSFFTQLCLILVQCIVHWCKKDTKRHRNKGKKEHLICDLSTLICQHCEKERQEMPQISYTGLLTLPHPAVARPFNCRLGLLKHIQCTMAQLLLIYCLRVPSSILFYSWLGSRCRRILQKAQGQAAHPLG